MLDVRNNVAGFVYIESTKVLQQAAGILGITFMDHIIITKNDYFSFLEHDML